MFTFAYLQSAAAKIYEKDFPHLTNNTEKGQKDLSASKQNSKTN
jgi:hypothetical protein